MQKGEKTVIKLEGSIDSTNVQEKEAEIQRLLPSTSASAVVLDAQDLEYISSAGLRAILRIRRAFPSLSIVNVSPEIYATLETTGFTEIMTVEKAYRSVSVDGCEVIGEGANGKVYRIDGDNVVKVYGEGAALEDILHEREVARLALVLGVPTAISYDVVKVGSRYGSVFELLNARSFAKILAEEPERFDWCVREYVGMLKIIHSISVPEGKLPPAKDAAVRRAGRIKDLLPDGLGEKLERMVREIPASDRMIHGDYHTKNIVLADGEVLIIDMDTLSVGHPIFELSQMYNSYKGFSEYDPEIVRRFQGYPAVTARRFWRESLMAYLGTRDEAKVSFAEDRVRCLSYVRLIEWMTRHSDLSNEEDRLTMKLWMDELTGLLRRTDSLVFDPSGLADA